MLENLKVLTPQLKVGIVLNALEDDENWRVVEKLLSNFSKMWLGSIPKLLHSHLRECWWKLSRERK
ncbi:hypothetical protein LguiA_030070 [Lonicera macranthoides]